MATRSSWLRAITGAGGPAAPRSTWQTSYLYRVRNGKIVRAELYRDREAALNASGWRE